MNSKCIHKALDQVQIDFDEKILHRRSTAMDVFEGLLDTSPHWPILRKKLLGFFGESGVQGDLRTIVAQAKLDHSQIGSINQIGGKK